MLGRNFRILYQALKLDMLHPFEDNIEKEIPKCFIAI